MDVLYTVYERTFICKINIIKWCILIVIIFVYICISISLHHTQTYIMFLCLKTYSKFTNFYIAKHLNMWISGYKEEMHAKWRPFNLRSINIKYDDRNFLVHFTQSSERWQFSIEKKKSTNDVWAVASMRQSHTFVSCPKLCHRICICPSTSPRWTVVNPWPRLLSLLLLTNQGL